jgi:iron complex outermembrane receptor protein
VCVCVRPTESVAEDTADYLSQISELNLEDLLTQEVSTVLRKEQPLSGAAAAVYVLTAEDIRRSGAASLPEALRLVPGVTVTRTNAWNWEITVRGFDSDGSAKLLVLIDGRSVYSPLYSGVFWDVQNVVLSDVERVEVIRGPGAVSWGENAVNGVINIITKSAKDTQGGLVQGGGGKEEEGFGTLRYGGKISDDIHYRVYGTGFKRDNFRNIDGSDAKDGWNMAQGGFRIDGQLTEKNSFTAQGDIYDGDASENILRFESFAPPFTNRIKNQINLHGGNALLRFNRNESEESQLSFQTYYDRTERFTDLYSETRDTFDFDFQHHYKVSEHHDIVYGASHRITTADIDNWPSLGFYPQHRTDHLTTAFVQDEIKLVPETFSVIPGVKLGHNSYTGFEYQPALKAVWTPPDRRQTVWASISRAVRIPAAIDTDIQAFGLGSVAPDGTPMVLGLYGNPDFDSEKLLAYELGYRAEPSKQFSFDVALYYQDYDQLLSL